MLLTSAVKADEHKKSHRLFKHKSVEKTTGTNENNQQSALKSEDLGKISPDFTPASGLQHSSCKREENDDIMAQN